jgi:hypothetical protein
MIIAKSAPAGAAKLVPAGRAMDTFDELRQFAQDVADAEGIGRSLSRTWGCVALLPRGDHPDLATAWRSLNIDSADILATYAAADVPMNSAAILDPALWVSAFDAFDALLATVTKPVESNPSIDDIAAAMGNPPAGNKAHAYFRGNRGVGITTFQDDEILAALATRGFAS